MYEIIYAHAFIQKLREQTGAGARRTPGRTIPELGATEPQALAPVTRQGLRALRLVLEGDGRLQLGGGADELAAIATSAGSCACSP